ncbi:MAG: DUF177 domain-containing protein [Elusimicrobiales bacterium]|nr:DUF177 domain-containing protein [Elusimicrobiales bacterium]
MIKNKCIEFNLSDIKKSKIFEYTTIIQHNWFEDCETEFYKILSANSYFKFETKNSSILVTIKFSFTVEHICSRCGESFKEFMNEDMYEIYEQNQIIDLFPLLRESVILNQPIKILCNKCKKVKE